MCRGLPGRGLPLAIFNVLLADRRSVVRMCNSGSYRLVAAIEYSHFGSYVICWDSGGDTGNRWYLRFSVMCSPYMVIIARRNVVSLVFSSVLLFFRLSSSCWGYFNICSKTIEEVVYGFVDCICEKPVDLCTVAKWICFLRDIWVGMIELRGGVIRWF